MILFRLLPVLAGVVNAFGSMPNLCITEPPLLLVAGESIVQATFVETPNLMPCSPNQHRCIAGTTTPVSRTVERLSISPTLASPQSPTHMALDLAGLGQRTPVFSSPRECQMGMHSLLGRLSLSSMSCWHEH
jgi:hypothetical protein